MSSERSRHAGWSIAAAVPILAGLAATLLAYWPGLMTWDAIRQYDQATSGQYDDWHPPAMEWLWRQLIPIAAGPAPMLLLQTLLYWSGFALLAGWAIRGGRRRLGVVLAACGLLPLAVALMGAVLKDCLMAGALSAATGLLAWSLTGLRRPRAIAARGVGILLLVAAASLRFNAFLACLPLLIALLPPVWRRGWRRMVPACLIATAVLIAAMPVANRAIGAQRSGVELSLIIFDLGGITERSGVNVFPPLGVADPVAVNHRCYTAVKWDSYSYWVDPLCPLGFDRWRADPALGGSVPYRLWLAAILAHPIAYAEHRLAHFNINARFLIHDPVERAVQVESAPNDWGYRVTPGRMLSAVDAVALASAATPLGWPMLWLALATGVLMLAPVTASRALVMPLAWSGLLYGSGYLVVSVAAELRYHLWTMVATLIALVLTIADIAVLPQPPWRRIALATAPAVVVLVLGAAWRL